MIFFTNLLKAQQISRHYITVYSETQGCSKPIPVLNKFTFLQNDKVVMKKSQEAPAERSFCSESRLLASWKFTSAHSRAAEAPWFSSDSRTLKA